METTTATMPAVTPITSPEGMIGEAFDLPATDISFEDYLDKFAPRFCEYVDGKVIRMSLISIKHFLITKYLFDLLDTYLLLRPIGIVLAPPVVLRLPTLRTGREPDMQVILNERRAQIKDTYVEGPVDICVEVVSPDSIVRDRGEKFVEYAGGGVPEYWLLDPLRNEARFYRLDQAGTYIPREVDAAQRYRTPALPGFVLPVTALWGDTLPNRLEVLAFVRETLNAETPTPTTGQPS